MTEITAKAIFDMMVTEVRNQGFTDIGSFMIDEVQKDFEFEQFKEGYEYRDSYTIIDETELLSTRPHGSSEALMLLLDASIDYFTLASQIPSRFQFQMIKLTNNKNESSNILLNTVNEREENLTARLNNPAVQELITLLRTIRNNIDRNDDTILRLINEL